MKKLFALLLALMMVLSLAACGGGDDDKTPSSDDKTPSSTQQQEQNTPDPDEGEDEPDNSGNEETPDPGTSGNAGGSTIADANAWLAERGFTGFTIPDDLAVANIGLRDTPAAVLAVFCPIESARYEEVLQSLFSDTGMTAETTAGEAATSLDDCLSTISCKW